MFWDLDPCIEPSRHCQITTTLFPYCLSSACPLLQPLARSQSFGNSDHHPYSSMSLDLWDITWFYPLSLPFLGLTDRHLVCVSSGCPSDATNLSVCGFTSLFLTFDIIPFPWLPLATPCMLQSRCQASPSTQIFKSPICTHHPQRLPLSLNIALNRTHSDSTASHPISSNLINKNCWTLSTSQQSSM